MCLADFHVPTFCMIVDKRLDLFFDRSRYVAMATNFRAKIVKIGRLHLYSARWRSETYCRIAFPISVANW